MLDMQLPWWELVVRGVAVYGVLLLMVRLSGKRTVGQFTPFDLLVVMLLSESVSNALSGGDDSLISGLLLAGVLVTLNALVGMLSSRSRAFERAIEGSAVLLGRDGHIYDEVTKTHRVGRGDIDRALREADCPLKDMRCIFLEADGSLSVLKKKAS
jgi:uncharacterized membrane protein YcaP (DUF421 family)